MTLLHPSGILSASQDLNHAIIHELRATHRQRLHMQGISLKAQSVVLPPVSALVGGSALWERSPGYKHSWVRMVLRRIVGEVEGLLAASLAAMSSAAVVTVSVAVMGRSVRVVGRDIAIVVGEGGRPVRERGAIRNYGRSLVESSASVVRLEIDCYDSKLRLGLGSCASSVSVEAVPLETVGIADSSGPEQACCRYPASVE